MFMLITYNKLHETKYSFKQTWMWHTVHLVRRRVLPKQHIVCKIRGCGILYILLYIFVSLEMWRTSAHKPPPQRYANYKRQAIASNWQKLNKHCALAQVSFLEIQLFIFTRTAYNGSFNWQLPPVKACTEVPVGCRGRRRVLIPRSSTRPTVDVTIMMR